jgi:hypothetical protein
VDPVLEGLGGALGEVELEDSSYEQIGDHVVVDMLVAGTPRDGGSRIELPVAQLFRVRNGAVCMYGI